MTKSVWRGEWTTTHTCFIDDRSCPWREGQTAVSFRRNGGPPTTARQEGGRNRKPDRLLSEDFRVPAAIGVAEPGADPVRGEDP